MEYLDTSSRAFRAVDAPAQRSGWVELSARAAMVVIFLSVAFAQSCVSFLGVTLSLAWLAVQQG
jgi:hypothetical protein